MVVDYLLLCDAYWDTAAASDIVLYDLVYDRFSDRVLCNQAFNRSSGN